MNFSEQEATFSYHPTLHFQAENYNTYLQPSSSSRVEFVENAAVYYNGDNTVVGQHELPITHMTGFYAVGYTGSDVIMQNRHEPRMRFRIVVNNYITLTMMGEIETLSLGLLIRHTSYSQHPVLVPEDVFLRVRAQAERTFSQERPPEVGSSVVFASMPGQEFIYLGCVGDNLHVWDHTKHHIKTFKWSTSSLSPGTSDKVQLNPSVVETIVESANRYHNRYSVRSTGQQEQIPVQAQALFTVPALETLFNLTPTFCLKSFESLEVVSNGQRANRWYTSNIKFYHRKDGKYTINSNCPIYAFSQKTECSTLQEVVEWLERLRERLMVEDRMEHNSIIFAVA